MEWDKLFKIVEAAVWVFGQMATVLIVAVVVMAAVRALTAWARERRIAEQERFRLAYEREWAMASLLVEQTRLIVELEKARETEARHS